jgi:hypothetical protein
MCKYILQYTPAKCYCQVFLQFFYKNFKKISYNVSAVGDGLTARIEKCVAFLGLAKCAGATAWEWSVPQLRWGAG